MKCVLLLRKEKENFKKELLSLLPNFSSLLIVIINDSRFLLLWGHSHCDFAIGMS